MVGIAEIPGRREDEYFEATCVRPLWEEKNITNLYFYLFCNFFYPSASNLSLDALSQMFPCMTIGLVFSIYRISFPGEPGESMLCD